MDIKIPEVEAIAPARAGRRRSFSTEEKRQMLEEVKQLQAQVRELERLLGRKSLENEVLRDAVRLAREKNCSWGRPRRRGARREDRW